MARQVAALTFILNILTHALTEPINPTLFEPVCCPELFCAKEELDTLAREGGRVGALAREVRWFIGTALALPQCGRGIGKSAVFRQAAVTEVGPGASLAWESADHYWQ